MSRIIKAYIEDGVIVKIDYDTANPSRPKPGKHVTAKPHDKVRWENGEKVGALTVTFTDSPFESTRKVFTAGPGRKTSLEELIEADPDPNTGDNPHFPYTISIGAVTQDPEIVIDLGAGGGAPKKKAGKAVKKAVKKAPYKKKR